MGFYGGPLFIDDAYITFRYAENLALGKGFVYNADPILGVTTPLYCLLLAGLKWLGVPIESSALAIGAVCAGAAPVIIWLMGRALSRPLAGWVGALLLCLFPAWWLNSKTGMETCLGGALAAAALYAYIKERPAVCGFLCGILVLTRPDAATLPALIFLALLVRSPGKAAWFGFLGVICLAPWVAYSAAIFGSPLPHSLEAKRLIHSYPWPQALFHYLAWFGYMRDASESAGALGPGRMALGLSMGLMSFLYLAGLARTVSEKGKAVVAAAWPIIFIASLALTGVGPFFWYKVPALPMYFFACGFGVLWLHEAGGGKRSLALFAKAAAVFFVAAQLVNAYPMVSSAGRRAEFIDKERALREAAQAVDERVSELGLFPDSVKVYAGEVGVVGYELGRYFMIDSAGINSREVTEIRLRDWERARANDPSLDWRDKWRGTPEWSREVIGKFKPDYIVSDVRYVHLKTLAEDPEFRKTYLLLKSWDYKDGKIVALERKRQGPAKGPE